jgi:hypothetical protein
MNDRQESEGRVGFQPIVAFDGDGRLVGFVLRLVRRPDGRQIVTPLRRPIAPIRSIGRGLRSCCVATATIAHRKRYASDGNLGDIRLPALRPSGYQVQHLQLYP